MGGSVCSFAWQDGTLCLTETLSLLPQGHMGDGAGAAIKRSKDGQYLYVTERATQKIVILAVNGAHLTLLGQTDCAGKEPRDLALVANDTVALCTNQFSDCLAIFRVTEDRTLKLWNTVSISSPLCVIEIPIS